MKKITEKKRCAAGRIHFIRLTDLWERNIFSHAKSRQGASSFVPVQKLSVQRPLSGGISWPTNYCILSHSAANCTLVTEQLAFFAGGMWAFCRSGVILVVMLPRSYICLPWERASSHSVAMLPMNEVPVEISIYGQDAIWKMKPRLLPLSYDVLKYLHHL